MHEAVAQRLMQQRQNLIARAGVSFDRHRDHVWLRSTAREYRADLRDRGR